MRLTSAALCICMDSNLQVILTITEHCILPHNVIHHNHKLLRIDFVVVPFTLHPPLALAYSSLCRRGLT